MSSFVDSLPECFEPFGRVEARRMFGGHGIFHQGRMIGLVARDTLYLKADGQTAGFFEALSLPPFTYLRQGREATLNYREAPVAFFEDRDAAALWAGRAWEAALRGKGTGARVRPKAGAGEKRKRPATRT